MADGNILSDFGIDLLEEEIDDVIFQTNEFLTDATFTGSQGPFWWLAHFCLFLRCQHFVNQYFTNFRSVRKIPNGTKTGQNYRKIKSRTPCSEYPSLNICCTGTKVQICPVKSKSKHLNITGSVRFLFSCIKADNTNEISSQMGRKAGKGYVKICFPSFGRMPGEDVATLRLFCHMIVQKSKPHLQTDSIRGVKRIENNV